MNLTEYYDKYGRAITQESERLFVDEFLYPMLGSKIELIKPQYPFIDNTGKNRKIDFVYQGERNKLALEVNGETYHAEGIIPDGMFDDNLFRQNEILRQNYHLVRFSYSQLQSPGWRPLIKDQLRDFFGKYAPELLTEYELNPTPLQEEVLDALDFYRNTRHWTKGVIVLPTGTGKTILSAMDAKRHGGRVLFLVHRLDILRQSIDAYKKVWPDLTTGLFTGEVRENEKDCQVLFASKDSLRRPEELSKFGATWFDYIVIDEVHHGQSPTYREILNYFRPSFMIGMTATPDRTDRRDIFELFDYNKVYEIPLAEAIERGFLVPYTYIGLTDSVDYSKIRFGNQRYRVDDLERLLIIPERNEAIVREYLERGSGDKAIGFCVSIKHADRMAEVFQNHGISAVSIHSGLTGTNRDQLLQDFRNNKLNAVFTVDLFNEGVDFPNVRVLLFLRPTESKTVFLQQLGRGLRLCSGKNRVIVLDFIGNYKRANQIRKYLSKGSNIVEERDQNGRLKRKIQYTYSTGCEIIFDSNVEEVLNRQDAEELGVTTTELEEAYFELAERLGRKPSRTELDEHGKYKSAIYAQLYGSWIKFLREIGEYTEASYHYPQGVHLGHILLAIQLFGSNNRTGSQFDDEYIRLRGELGEGRLSTYRRQIKYKLQAAMELGILTDDRNYLSGSEYKLELTSVGRELYTVLRPLLKKFDFSCKRDSDGIPTTKMAGEDQINTNIRAFLSENKIARELFYKVFLKMHAIQQMLAFLYHIIRTKEVTKKEIYDQFFQAPFVKQYCDQAGIEQTTVTAAEHRCPFLLNILESCDVIDTDTRKIAVKKLVLAPFLVSPYTREDSEKSQNRLQAIYRAWPSVNSQTTSRNASLIKESPALYLQPSDEDISIVRELFGPKFLTDEYYLKDIIVLEG